MPRPPDLTARFLAEASASFQEYARRHPEARMIDNPWEVYLAGHWLRRELIARGVARDALDELGLAHRRLVGQFARAGDADPWRAAELILAVAHRGELEGRGDGGSSPAG